MFFGAILGSWAVMNIYVCWRLFSTPIVRKRVRPFVLITITVFFASSYLLSRMLGGIPWVARPLEIIGANWIGVLFLAFVCFLAVDLITLFGLVLPHLADRLRTWALVVCGVLSVVALVQGLRAPMVESYEIRVSRLPASADGTVIVMLSDLHLGSLLNENWAEARVQQVMNLHPDIVVLCGDIIEGDDPSEVALLSKLHELSAPMGVWAAVGNHESHGRGGGPNNVLETAGVRVLRNGWSEVRPGLVIAGVEDLTHTRRIGMSSDAIVTNVLAKVPPAAATVLISHSPMETEIASSKGVSLMLSGHTHDGQIWPFNYVVQQIYPYMAGQYQVGAMKLIVCRGTGTWGPRMRLWRPGEIAKITIRAES